MDENALTRLREIFGTQLQENVHMSNYTTINIGGAADALLILYSAASIEKAITELWHLEIPFLILGSGSNVLISDQGIREVVIINRAHNLKIITNGAQNKVWAESGSILSQVARQAGWRGLTGLEWAAAIPGTVGGAVYGNAGAFGRDISCNLTLAEILHHKNGKENWSNERLAFTYRSSLLKREPEDSVILSATFNLEHGELDEIKARMDDYRKKRMSNQPPGASMGSVFCNPPEQKAGHLIEAVGLKGKSIGMAEISPTHANFIINTGVATAQDILDLIELCQRKVEDQMNVHLKPEIQFIGEWDETQKKKINMITGGIG